MVLKAIKSKQKYFVSAQVIIPIIFPLEKTQNKIWNLYYVISIILTKIENKML